MYRRKKWSYIQCLVITDAFSKVEIISATPKKRTKSITLDTGATYIYSANDRMSRIGSNVSVSIISTKNGWFYKLNGNKPVKIAVNQQVTRRAICEKVESILGGELKCAL